MRESLIESEGLKCEGIFRVAGDHSEVNKLKLQMNGKTFKGAADPPSVANLVKVCVHFQIRKFLTSAPGLVPRTSHARVERTALRDLVLQHHPRAVCRGLYEAA